jgi:transcriptional regulator with XRE-family HTH domain
MASNILLLSAFGEAVREARKKIGLSQEELAERADLHRTYIGMIERGEKNITMLNAEKIAKALEHKLSTLIKRAEHLSQSPN